MSEQPSTPSTPRKRGPRPRPAAPAARQITLEDAIRAANIGQDRQRMIDTAQRMLNLGRDGMVALVWGSAAGDAIMAGSGLLLDPPMAQRTLEDMIEDLDSELRALGVDVPPAALTRPGMREDTAAEGSA